jgi:2-(1,2-epoxy-1,2-dihydrophenyl)acetyl-CoA isomerase
MEFNEILYEKEPNGICTLTINMPKRRNALSFMTFYEIELALDDMIADKKARVLIITGAEEGNAFSSGGYFNMSEMSNWSPDITEKMDLEDIAIKKLAMKLWDFPKPIIAAINGLAIGAGITMPLATADLIYMADDAWAGFFFVKRAIVPEFGLSFILPMLVGFQRAKEILFFGDEIPAQKCLEWGLINGVIPHDELMSHCRKVAERLIPPKGPSVSLRFMKKIMHDYFRPIISETLDKENIGLRINFKTADFRASVKALQTKTDANFKGRANKMVEDTLDAPFDLEAERNRPKYTE